MREEKTMSNVEQPVLKLTDKRNFYKPFQYQWAYDYGELHRKMNWTKEEVRSLQEDILDWHEMSDEKRKPLELLLLYFTQADWDIGASYIDNLLHWYKAPELRYGIIRTIDREATHMDNYDLLPEQFGIVNFTYQALLDIDTIYDQHEFMQSNSEDGSLMNRIHVLTKHIAGEGIAIYGIFLMLLNESRYGRMKCLGQEIVSWSARDENQHVSFITKLLNTELDENTGDYDLDEVRLLVCNVLNLSLKRALAYAETVLGLGELEGLSFEQIERFLKVLVNNRVRRINIGVDALYPEYTELGDLSWATDLFVGSLDNFFETAGTNYQLGAMTGDWEYPDENYMKDSDLEKYLQEN